ncbi:brachyurin-like [Zophobas morio]|uniref:brachyurin-like n=1 Tax=Zophobas morio TaxID=2755281 RepID=UPI0030833B4E
MKSFVAFLFILTVSCTFSKPTNFGFRNLYKTPKTKVKINPRIIGGQEAEPHSIPYQVLLEAHSETQFWYCGGSLISQNYVLTAGHCGVDATEIYVTLGAHKPLEDEDTQITLISTEVKIHEDYDGDKLINDIGLIKLPEPVTFTSAIQPAILPSYHDSENTYAGDTARVSGWGLTSMYETKLSEVLNYLDMEVMSNEACIEFFEDVIPSIVCTSGENETGSCSGDSGGPLVFDDVQIGVVSFGVIFCMPSYPSGFTRITSFLEWIETNSDVELNN